MVLKLIVAKKFTELLLFEVRCKKSDRAAGAAPHQSPAVCAVRYSSPPMRDFFYSCFPYLYKGHHKAHGWMDGGGGGGGKW